MNGSRHCKIWKALKIVLLFAMVALCLIANALARHSGAGGLFSGIEVLFGRSDTQWLFSIYILVWCVCFILLMFRPEDILLIGLLLAGGFLYAVKYQTAFQPGTALVFLCGITAGKGARFALETGSQRSEVRSPVELRTPNSELRLFLVGLVLLLAVASWWHLDGAASSYHGPRWMGLWNNPNDYGMLMGAGVVLAIGLLAVNLKSEKLKAEIERRKLLQILKAESRKQKLLIGFLLVAVLMMGTGLIFSYSRGAWVATGIGSLYLAKAYGKFKWRSPKVFLLSAFCFLLLLFGVWFFWNTPQTAPWYFQRLDLSRGSVQHRLAAWKAGFEIMRDHPFGIGWQKTIDVIDVYQKNYSPPEGGAPAITTNDYLMLGTQLGFPGLLCFVAYVALAMKGESRKQKAEIPSLVTRHLSLRMVCRAAALAMLWRFGLTADCSSWPRRRCFGFCLTYLKFGMRSAECGIFVRMGGKKITRLKFGRFDILLAIPFLWPENACDFYAGR